ncbi:hypothetical protein SRHO_G00141950 [Serrasalmus rhombeus]
MTSARVAKANGPSVGVTAMFPSLPASRTAAVASAGAPTEPLEDELNTRHASTVRVSASLVGLCGQCWWGRLVWGNLYWKHRLGPGGLPHVQFCSVSDHDCIKARAELDGNEVSVVDTPGLFDSDLAETAVMNRLVECISLSSPGPHGFLLVLSVGRFTQED